ncbi:hypothetical protein FHS03_001331 [Massilia violacea]|uniref:Uncharacterized protein n=1 Tax=Pseudoduganella violacea TaxID=1715466 RepID=A0A7W5B8S4_9BURK|nr:hypothetical protein [Pseudoduganella violacea]MBB3118300.1 hypothetical protein [Pseudoduganella violacea]
MLFHIGDEVVIFATAIVGKPDTRNGGFTGKSEVQHITELALRLPISRSGLRIDFVTAFFQRADIQILDRPGAIAHLSFFYDLFRIELAVAVGIYKYPYEAGGVIGITFPGKSQERRGGYIVIVLFAGIAGIHQV